MSIVGLVEDGSSRWYQHPVTGDRYESVTTVLGAALAKPWLSPWAAKIAARYAVEHRSVWERILREKGPAEAVAHIAAEARRLRELKADIGSYVHHVIEALLLDAPIPGIPPHLDGVNVDGEVVDQAWLDILVDGWLAFHCDHDPATIAAEATVAHDNLKVAGTLDWTGRLPKTRFGDAVVMADVKTGKHLDPTFAWQLEAYRRAPYLWLPGGRVARTPRAEHALVLHIRGEYRRGYKLIPVAVGDEAWAGFLACRDVLHAAEAAPPIEAGLPVYPLQPDGTEPPVLIEDVWGIPGYRRYVAPLLDAGLETLQDVARFTPAELKGVRGVGDRAPAVLAGLLALHGLELAAPSRVEVA